ncbi:MAG: glycosyltransferase family 2 protein [Actinomycetota bacterium]
MGSPLVDVVVVSYNSRDRLRACVEGLAALDWVRVVVVDNASRDGSLDAVAGIDGVATLAMPRNGGFAYGCNAGWRAGSAPYVLFLNPDAVMDGDDLRRLVDVLEARPRAGAVGPRITHDDGSLDHSIRRFPALRSTFAQALFLHRLFPRAGWTDEVVRDPERYTFAGPVGWLSGACILCRRDVLVAIDGLDEGFFLYCEDIDLCRRIRDAGREVLYEPAAHCRHAGGASHPRAELLPVLAASRLRYARKHRGAASAGLERAGIALGEATHALVGRGGLAERAGHGRAMWVAVTGRGPARDGGPPPGGDRPGPDGASAGPR